MTTFYGINNKCYDNNNKSSKNKAKEEELYKKTSTKNSFSRYVNLGCLLCCEFSTKGLILAADMLVWILSNFFKLK
jgi:hypothetical protein